MNFSLRDWQKRLAPNDPTVEPDGESGPIIFDFPPNGGDAEINRRPAENSFAAGEISPPPAFR
jgi:hypothetical protein